MSAIGQWRQLQGAAVGVRAQTRVAIPPVMLGAPGAGPQLSAPGARRVSIRYVAQTEDNWCWAACASMLLSRPGFAARSQCDIASVHWGQACCPSPGAPAVCDQGEWPHIAYPPHGIATSFFQVQLTEDEVRSELAAQRPVEVCYQWSGSSSTHVALIVGETPNGDFEVYDPSYGAGVRSFGQIQSAYGLGAWIYSFTF